MKFNKTVAVAAIVGLLVAGVATAQKVSTLPLAPTPFDGTEGIYIFKAGQSFRSTVLEIAKQIVALTPGVNGQSPTVIDHVATWANTAGTLIKDSGVAISRVVQGPVSSTVGHVATFNNTAGNTVADSGVTLGTMAPENSNNVLITGGAITGLSVLSGTVGTLTGGTYATPTLTNPISTNGTFTSPTISSPVVSNGGFTSPSIATPTVTGGTFANGVYNTPTIVSPAITSPTVTAGVFNTPTINGGFFFPTSNTQATSYTIASTDCSSKISLTGGANQTITIPAGLTANCEVLVSNETGHAWHIAASGITTFWIWPGQLCRFELRGTTYTSNCPYRWIKPSANLYVGTAGAGCNDTHDGLSPDPSGYLCTANMCIFNIQTYIDTQRITPLCNLGNGTFTESIFMAAQPTGGADQIQISGNGTGNTSVIAPVGTAAFGTRDFGILTVTGVTIGCLNAEGVHATQYSVIDLSNVQFGSCDNGPMITASNTGHVNCTGGITLNGNGANFILAQDGGNVTCTVLIGVAQPINFSTSFVETTGGGSKLNSIGTTFSNPGFVSGVSFLMAGMGEIDVGGAGTGFFPGSAPGTGAGTTIQNGYYH